MERLFPMNAREQKEMIKRLYSQFGFSGNIDGILMRTKAGKVYVSSRGIHDIDLSSLRIDKAGLYIGEMMNHIFRPSVEGSQVIGERCKKNIISLPSQKVFSWLKGEDVDVEDDGDSFVLVMDKEKKDFLGCGRLKDKRLTNYYPKSRRLKTIASEVD